MQGAALLGAQRAEDLVLDGREAPLGGLQGGQPLGGEIDDVAAAIVGVAPTRGEAARFEIVEQADEIARIESKCFGERLLTGRAVVAQQRQRNEVARSQTVWIPRRVR